MAPDRNPTAQPTRPARLSPKAMRAALIRVVAEASERRSLLAGAGDLILRLPARRLVWFGELDPQDGQIIPLVDARSDGKGGAQLAVWDERQARRARFPLPQPEGLPAVELDLDRPAVANPWRDAARSLGCRVHAWTPLMRGGFVIGAMGVYSSSPSAVRPAELACLQSVASDLGHALARMEAESRTARHLRELEIVRELTEEMISKGDPAAFLEMLVLRAAALLGGSSGSVYLVEPDGESVRCVVSHPSPPDYTGTVLRFGVGAAGAVAESGRPLMVADYPTWPGRTGLFQEQGESGSRALLSVPMSVLGRVVGVLHIWRQIGQPAFDEAEADLLQLLANQAAIALENSRLLSDSRRRLYQMTLLNDLTRSALEAADLRPVLGEMAHRIAELTGSETCLIHLSGGGERGSAGQPGWWWFAPQRPTPSAQALEAVGRCLATDGTLVLDGETSDAVCSAALGAFGLHSALMLPLRGNERHLGGVVIGFRQPHRFLSEEIALSEQVAGQLAMALARSLAYEAERERSAQLEALHQANLRLTSQLELGSVMETILEDALRMVAADDAHIFFYDGERVSFGAARWAAGSRREPYAQPRPNGLTYTVARSGERIVVPDVRNHSLFRDTPWQGAIVGLPLRIAGQVVGVMNVAFTTPHAFNESELRVLDILADQAAVALQNARLYEETSGERQRVQLLYDLAQALASLTDRDDILQQATDLTVQSLEAHFGEAFLVEPGSDRMRLRGLAGKGTEWKARIDRQFRARVGRGLVGWVAEKRLPVIVGDVREDPRWIHVPHLDENIRSALGAPILSGDDLLGVLMIFDRRRGAFDQRHLDLLVAISRQVGLALSNAEGFEQVRRRLAELTILQQVAQAVNRRLELQALLEEVVHQVSQVLGYPVVEILLIEGEELVRRAGTGSEESVPARMSLQEGVVGRVARTNRPSLVMDVELDPDYIPVLPHTQTELVVPLRKGGVVFGVLNVESPAAASLGDDDQRLLSLLADQLSVAIENAALYDHLRQHADSLERTVADRTAALAEALNQAQEADRMKSQFVSDVSHELRTPLSNIRLYLDLIKGGKPGRFGSYLETLNRETGRLVSLIEDLLAISRLEAGSTQLELAPLDLNKLAAGLVEDRQRLFREKGLELRLEPTPALPPVMADERALAHAVANLMTNALHYTSSGSVTISTGRRESDGRSWETLTVTDTGLGIAEAEQPHLFTRFYRGAAGRTTRVPGTGLGLAICRETIARHGGRITLLSRLGEGSAFTLWLPLEPAG